MAFKEADLEKVFIDLLLQEGFEYVLGNAINRVEGEVLIEQDFVITCIVVMIPRALPRMKSVRLCCNCVRFR